MKVTSYERPEKIMYMPLPDGRADVWLRKNITESEDGEGAVCWEYDEVYIRTTLSVNDIDLGFDVLFNTAEKSTTPAPTVDERVRDLELQIEEQAGAIEELAAIIAGGE